MKKLNIWQRGALNDNDVHRPIDCRLLYVRLPANTVLSGQCCR